MAAHRFLSLLLVFYTTLISSLHAYQFKVGGRDGWVSNPSENYNHWAESMRFQVNDTLFFKYRKGSDSVLVVNRGDYVNCTTDNPIMKMEDGNSVFKFDRSGPFYFITGNNQSCQQGQKLMTVVLAVRNQPSPPSRAPAPGVFIPPSPSPLPVSPTPAITPVSPSPETHTPVPSPASIVSPTPAITPVPSPAPIVSPTPAITPVSPTPTSLSPTSVPPSSETPTTPSPPALSPSNSGAAPPPAGSTPGNINSTAPPRAAASAFTPSVVLVLSVSFVFMFMSGFIAV